MSWLAAYSKLEWRSRGCVSDEWVSVKSLLSQPLLRQTLSYATPQTKADV